MRTRCSLAIGLLAFVFSAHAQEEDLESLAQAAQNPVASMISLPFQNNTDFNFGPNNDTFNVLNIQPVWPFELNEDWNLITRTILPVVSVPGVAPGDSRTTGLGDTVFTAFFSPSAPSPWTWGAGPVVLIPTATDSALGADEWGLGASAVVLTMRDAWVVGSLFSNVWSVGAAAGNEVNLFTWQYFVNYNMDNGWYLVTAPIITADWEAQSGEKWTVPFGGGFGRIFRIGKQPVNFNMQAFYNVEKPSFVGDWGLRLQFQLMFPK